MGRSDSILKPWYKSIIKPKGDVALLGFTNNNLYQGDLYDIQLNNWDINSSWSLSKSYDTIVCTRCAYFAQNPQDFILRCHQHLKTQGALYVDWGLGDHWRFSKYKIGWIKDDEHEYAYQKNNFLWSTIWDNSFLEDSQFTLFANRVKRFGYDCIYSAIKKEVPKVLHLNSISKFFDIKYKIKTIHKDCPQLYILLTCKKI
jgi:hypothetical protein